MNYQVDVMIIGDSKVGHEILDNIASNKRTIKVAFISNVFKSTTTRDYLNVEYFKDEVEVVFEGVYVKLSSVLNPIILPSTYFSQRIYILK